MVGIYDDPNRFRRKEKLPPPPEESKKVMPRKLEETSEPATSDNPDQTDKPSKPIKSWDIAKKKPFIVPYGTTDENDWMTSYSDMMTLLFAFFAMLLAMSQIDPVKMEIISQVMKKAMGATEIEPRISLAQIQNDLNKIVAESGIGEMVDVNRDKNGVSLSLKGSSYFKSGSVQLVGSTLPFLSIIAEKIKTVPYQIAIEGHTDNVPIRSGQFPSNWELSASRSAEVVRFFIKRGVDKDILRAIGYADTRPVDDKIGNRTAEARARNRRVVILFLNEVN